MSDDAEQPATAAGATQPPLPEGVPWPEVTERWWSDLGKDERTKSWGVFEWIAMADTALCHADVWGGNLDRLPELRARLAEFGFTPAAAARLGAGKQAAGAAGPAKERPKTAVDEFTAAREARTKLLAKTKKKAAT